MGSASAASGGKYAAALAVLATVFFMWGFATVLNDILVPHLKAVFQLNYGQSLLISSCSISFLPAARRVLRVRIVLCVVGQQDVRDAR